MDVHYGWPLATTALMFVSFYIGKLISFAHGYDIGRKDGILDGSKGAARVVMEMMRKDWDVNISDVEIRAVVDGIKITEEKVDE